MLDLALHTKPPTTDLQPPKHHRQPTAPHNQNPRADGINADLMGASMTHNACRIAGTVARNRHGLHGTTDLHPPKGSTIANLLQPLPQLMSRQEYRFVHSRANRLANASATFIADSTTRPDLCLSYATLSATVEE